MDNNLSYIFNAIFKNRKDWDFITDDQKEKYFFIINRNFSKKYPEKAQLFNLKSINKISSMNLWFNFFENKPYPNWFWSKGDKADKSEIPEKDYKALLKILQIKDIDLDYLIDKHPEFIKEELTWLKKVN